MKLNIITLMPEMVEQALSYGVVGSAFRGGPCLLQTINPRKFTDDNYQTVDDRPFGGGDGMLMLAEPLQKTLNHLLPSGPVFYLSPQGQIFDDKLAKNLSQMEEVTFICGRYGGVDHRFLLKNQIQELSLGDFVLSGGEPAAIAMVDSIVRKIPGVLGHAESATEDSFHNGLLELPYFTRPQNWEGMEVPPVLLSGHHSNIQKYKTYMGIVTTLVKRPDLLNKVKVPWQETLSYLESLSKENWQSTGWDRDKILMLVKDRLNE